MYKINENLTPYDTKRIWVYFETEEQKHQFKQTKLFDILKQSSIWGNYDNENNSYTGNEIYISFEMTI